MTEKRHYFDVVLTERSSRVEDSVTFEVEAVGFVDALMQTMEQFAKGPDKEMRITEARVVMS